MTDQLLQQPTILARFTFCPVDNVRRCPECRADHRKTCDRCRWAR